MVRGIRWCVACAREPPAIHRHTSGVPKALVIEIEASPTSAADSRCKAPSSGFGRDWLVRREIGPAAKAARNRSRPPLAAPRSPLAVKRSVCRVLLRGLLRLRDDLLLQVARDFLVV